MKQSRYIPAILLVVILTSCVDLKGRLPSRYPPDPAYQGAYYWLNPNEFLYICDHFQESPELSNRLWRYFQLVECNKLKSKYVQRVAAKLHHDWALQNEPDLKAGEKKEKKDARHEWHSVKAGLRGF